MQEELKALADVYYGKILVPGAGININWVRKEMMALGIRDENIDHLYIINAPLSREVWYYVFFKLLEEKKLDSFLNDLIERVGDVPLGKVKENLEVIGLCYDGKFRMRTFNIVVLASGRGTNLQAIIDAIEGGKINGKIVAVISDKKDAQALKRAEKHGIEAVPLPPKSGEKREEYDRRLARIVEEKRANLIVLAGFMRILSPWFVRKYRERIINIHPSLLPAFAGLYGEKVHRAVLEYGAKVSGCTVHFVTEDVDAGPIIVQKCVEVREEDTPVSLAERVLEKEHEAIVEAVKLISEGRVSVEGRRVKIKR